MMDWRERGRDDFRRGVPRVAGPAAEGTRSGDEWRLGWDEAAAKRDARRLEIAEIELLLRDGRFHLVDRDGRVLGTQVNVAVQQNEEGLAASVCFTGLSLRAER